MKVGDDSYKMELVNMRCKVLWYVHSNCIITMTRHYKRTVLPVFAAGWFGHLEDPTRLGNPNHTCCSHWGHEVGTTEDSGPAPHKCSQACTGKFRPQATPKIHEHFPRLAVMSGVEQAGAPANQKITEQQIKAPCD